MQVDDTHTRTQSLFTLPSLGLHHFYRYESLGSTNLPTTVDWRAASTQPQQPQGSCEASWAMAIASAAQSVAQIVVGRSTPLSVQQLLSCSTGMGCGGGVADSALRWVEANGGLDSAENQPYWGNDSSCRNSRHHVLTLRSPGYAYVPAGSGEAIRLAVSQHPVIVALGMSPAMKLYAGGIYSEPSSMAPPDHYMVIEGYTYTKGGGNNFWYLSSSPPCLLACLECAER